MRRPPVSQDRSLCKLSSTDSTTDPTVGVMTEKGSALTDFNQMPEGNNPEEVDSAMEETGSKPYDMSSTLEKEGTDLTMEQKLQYFGLEDAQELTEEQEVAKILSGSWQDAAFSTHEAAAKALTGADFLYSSDLTPYQGSVSEEQEPPTIPTHTPTGAFKIDPEKYARQAEKAKAKRARVNRTSDNPSTQTIFDAYQTITKAGSKLKLSLVAPGLDKTLDKLATATEGENPFKNCKLNHEDFSNLRYMFNSVSKKDINKDFISAMKHIKSDCESKIRSNPKSSDSTDMGLAMEDIEARISAAQIYQNRKS